MLQSAHIALIDSLMIAHTLKSMPVESVVKCVKKYASLDAERDVCADLESTCKLWVNKVTESVLACVDGECESYARQLKLPGKCQPAHVHLPPIGEDMSLSLANGNLLAVLVFFYALDVEFDMSDVCMHETVGFEESVENLNLVKEFCDKRLGARFFVFSFEDFLYSPLAMRVNKMAFIADLFQALEARPNTALVRHNHFDLFTDYMKSKQKMFQFQTRPL